MLWSVICIFLSVSSLATAQLNFQPDPLNSELLPSLDEKIFTSLGSAQSLAEALNASETFIDQLSREQGLPSLVFSVSIRGKTVYENAWGYADLENAVPAKLSTKYRIASISKTFTSGLIGTLVDKGLIRYADPLSKYISQAEFPTKVWKGEQVNITIGQLLSHTAGTHYTDISDFNTFWPSANVTQMIGKFKSEALHFKPGTDFLYSNYGFQLLGAVIESVTKAPYTKVMTDFFRHSLGLENSFVETAELMLTDRARYYQKPDRSSAKVNIPTHIFDQQFSQGGWWPSGGLLSTAPDLVKWGNRMVDTIKRRSNALLSPATLKEILTKRTTEMPHYTSHQTCEYGYGWVISNVNSTLHPSRKLRNFIFHTGHLVGISSVLVVYPEEEIVISAITNKGAIDNLTTMAFVMAENMFPFFKQN